MAAAGPFIPRRRSFPVIPSEETASATALFEDLLERYGGWLRQTLVRLCPSDLGIQVDDLEQEVRLRVWKALERERDVRHPASFLYRVAATTTLDAMRRARTRRAKDQQALAEDGTPEETTAAPLAHPGPSPELLARRHEVLAQADEVVRQLPPDRRRAVNLYLRGFSSNDIAELTGWTEPRARNLLYRGLAVLRSELRARGFDYEDT